MDMKTAASPTAASAAARESASRPRRLRGNPTLTLVTVAWA